MITVNEIFGPTIQGEGALVGSKTYFIRTHGCDNKCVWCDTQYAWDNPENTRSYLTEEDILALINVAKCRVVTLTGGNPCIQDLKELVLVLRRHGFIVHVETQGTVWNSFLRHVDHVTISPKPPSSSNTTLPMILDKFLEPLSRTSCTAEIKVVVFDGEDYSYAKHIHHQYPDYPFTLQAGTLPGADHSNIQWLVDKVMEDDEFNSNVRILPQLHVLLWGNKRGV